MSKLFVLSGLGALLLTSLSCSHYYYAPNTLQTPFLQNRHDTRVGVGLITGDEIDGYELNAVYSPVKYAAVMVNHFQVRSGENSSDTDWGRGRLTEVALGGYYPLGQYATLSLFAGWGVGNVFNAYDGPTVSSDLRFQRRFLQPTVSVQGRWFRFGTAVRLNQLEYVSGEVDVEIGEPHLTTIRNIEEASPIFVPEAGFMVGFGYKPIWGNIHLNFINVKDRENLGFLYSTLAMSVHVELNHFWRKKK